MTDPVAAVRKWLATPSPDTSKTEAFEREYIEALQHIHALLAEIDRLREQIRIVETKADMDKEMAFRRGWNAALRKGDEQ